ncbi:MAG: PepSY domain-containing protein [Gammaproteobacteria bacterium]|nr:PepSY domain-containing protein [Gammaproteobacteria bacterium]MCP5298818.1 PepSY domain-containing protein [Chromatiaceae bacterium]
MKRLLLASLIALLAAQGAVARDRWTSLDEAVSEARDRYNGRVLSAERRQRDGRDSYDIRILTNDGRVKRLRIDPESGRSGRGERSDRRGRR